MPQLHNETDKAQNKRLKAELAKERALVADLVEALGKCRRRFAEYTHLHAAKGTAEGLQKAARNLEMVDLIDTALKQANGKGL